MPVPSKKAKQDKPDPRGRIYTLETSDGKQILAREKALKQCQLFETLLRDSQGEDSIPVHDIGHRALKMVMEFCNNHIDDDEYIPPIDGTGVILDHKDIEVFKKLDSRAFEEVIKAANYVNNARLVDTALMYAIREMDGVDVDEIRKMFRLPDDMPAEVKQIFNPKKPERPIVELFSSSDFTLTEDDSTTMDT